MKIYLIDWNPSNSSDMIGGFDGDTLEQCFNTDKKLLSWSLQHTMKLKDIKSCEIEFLESHEALNELRCDKGLEEKPTFERWFDNWLKEYEYN